MSEGPPALGRRPAALELPLLGSNQDSPDPERRLACESRTYLTYTNREIVSSVCHESTSWMSELVRVC